MIRRDLFDWIGEEAVLLAKAESMRAFSGYTGEGYILAKRDLAVIVTDSRYTVQAEEQAPDCLVETISDDSHEQRVNTLLSRYGIGRVAFEDETWSVADHHAFCEACRDTEFVPVGDVLTQWRMQKADWEIEKIEKAAAITDRAFEKVLSFLKRGVTEKAAAWCIESAMREMGAEAMSFDPIVAFGENGAKPHAIPSQRMLRDGDLVVMDFGCKLDGYCSDMTRTVACGALSGECRRIYDVTLHAQREAKAALGPNKTGQAVDKVARDIITEAGYGDCFGHSLGHGVGLEIHELPRLSPSKAGETVLLPGHVVSVEPGIYLPGIGGVRIEDLCVVTQDGSRSLSQSPRELIVL